MRSMAVRVALWTLVLAGSVWVRGTAVLAAPPKSNPASKAEVSPSKAPAALPKPALPAGSASKSAVAAPNLANPAPKLATPAPNPGTPAAKPTVAAAPARPSPVPSPKSDDGPTPLIVEPGNCAFERPLGVADIAGDGTALRRERPRFDAPGGVPVGQFQGSGGRQERLGSSWRRWPDHDLSSSEGGRSGCHGPSSGDGQGFWQRQR